MIFFLRTNFFISLFLVNVERNLSNMAVGSTNENSSGSASSVGQRDTRTGSGSESKSKYFLLFTFFSPLYFVLYILLFLSVIAKFNPSTRFLFGQSYFPLLIFHHFFCCFLWKVRPITRNLKSVLRILCGNIPY